MASGSVACLGQAAAAQTPAVSAGADPVGEVVVTASRVARTGFSAPTPVTVLSADQVQARGAVNVAEVLNEIPAFRSSQTAQAASLSGQFSANFLDLRGLNSPTGTVGPARTLVLVDQRRFVPSTTTGQVDVNMIPSSLIARTEVVTGGASAAWGSDAVAGVVNLILKDKLQGVQGSASYGQSDKGDGQDYTFTLSAGSAFAGGRGHAIIGFEYDNSKGLPVTERARDWSRDLYGTISLPATRAAGLPSRILSRDIHFSNVMAPGGIITPGNGVGLDGRARAVPASLANTTFLPGGAPTAFRLGSLVSGNVMIGGDNAGYNTGLGSPLINPSQRDVGLARVTYDLTPSITAFAEVSYGHSAQDILLPQRTNAANLQIKVDNAFLPESIRQQMIAAGLASVPFGRIDTENGGYRQHLERDIRRGVIGLRGDLGAKWRWDAYYQYGYVQNFQATANNTINANYTAAVDAVVGANGQIVCRSLTVAGGGGFGGGGAAADPGCVPYNVFGQGSPSAASLAYITEPNFTHTFQRQQVGSVNLHGDLFETFAGPASFATGVEWREEASNVKVDANSLAGRFQFQNFQPLRGAFNVKEAYGEIVLPLAKDVGFIHSVDVNGAVRRTDYSTSGAVTTWKIGSTFEDSTRQLRLRATRSRDIRAPNLQELFANSNSVGNIRDPLTGLSNLTLTYANGNPSLVPEIADTLTYGGVISPKFLGGLRFSADYYDITIAQVIGTLGAQTVVDRCAAGALDLCSLVTRANGATGAITAVYNTQLNLSALKTSGWDFEASYRAPIEKVGVPGDLTLRALGTYVAHLTTIDSAGPVDRARQVVPRWAWNLSLNYNYNRFSANLTTRYIGPRVLDVTLIGPDDPRYNPTLPNSISKNTFPAVLYFNVSAQYTILKKDDRQLVLFGVVNNLTDRDPPNGGANNALGGVVYDLMGRFFRVGMRFNY